MSKIIENDIKTHENFRLILISRLDDCVTTDEDLILMSRPLQMVPALDFHGILTFCNLAIDEHHYAHHCE